MTNDDNLTQPEQTETAVGRRALFRVGPPWPVPPASRWSVPH